MRLYPALQPVPSSPPPKQQRAIGGSSGSGSQLASLGQQPQASAFQPQQSEQQDEQPCAVRSLLDACQEALLTALSPCSVCEVLQVADCLSPVVDSLRR